MFKFGFKVIRLIGLGGVRQENLMENTDWSAHAGASGDLWDLINPKVA